jgi:hypothetical protein
MFLNVFHNTVCLLSRKFEGGFLPFSTNLDRVGTFDKFQEFIEVQIMVGVGSSGIDCIQKMSLENVLLALLFSGQKSQLKGHVGNVFDQITQGDAGLEFSNIIVRTIPFPQCWTHTTHSNTPY